MDKKKKVKKNISKKDRVKNILVKIFSYQLKGIKGILFRVACFILFLFILSKVLFVKNREIICLRHKFSNDYCRCYAEQTDRNYYSYKDKELHKVAHEKCIDLFDKKEKDNRTVPTKEIGIIKENFSKAFMENCLRTSGRSEYCKCGLNEVLYYMTEDRWKIIYFGEKPNALEKDIKTYTEFMVKMLSEERLIAKKCKEKFSKTKK